MRRLSSIFAFETLTGPPRVTASLALAVAVCALFRVGLYVASDRLDHIPSPAIFPRYAELEDELIRSAPVRPKIVLMGNSMARYGLMEDRIAAAAGLETSEVVNLSIEGGLPWDTAVFIRRNPEFFRDAQLVIYNLGLSELQERQVVRRKAHYYRFSTLSEKMLADQWSDRVLMLFDWVWPYSSERRDLVTWALGFRGQSDHVVPEGLRPAWDPEKMAKLRSKWMPAVSALRAVSAESTSIDPSAISADWPEGTSRFQIYVLNELVGRWRQQGTRVLLLGMPSATAIYRVRHANVLSQTRLAQFDAAVASMQSEHVAYARWRSGSDVGLSDTDDFMDECHLTPAGAQKFTDLVVATLNNLNWMPPCASPSSLAMGQATWGQEGGRPSGNQKEAYSGPSQPHTQILDQPMGGMPKSSPR